MAIIFSLERFERTVCPGEDICSVDCQPDAIMSMSHFLFIAGAGGMAITIMDMLALTVVWKVFADTIDFAVEEGTETVRFIRSVDGVTMISSLNRFLTAFPSVLFRSAWCIVGCVLYFGQVDDDCSSTNEALMVLLWCIITLTISILELYRVIRSWDVDAEFTRLFAEASVFPCDKHDATDAIL